MQPELKDPSYSLSITLWSEILIEKLSVQQHLWAVSQQHAQGDVQGAHLVGLFMHELELYPASALQRYFKENSHTLMWWSCALSSILLLLPQVEPAGGTWGPSSTQGWWNKELFKHAAVIFHKWESRSKSGRAKSCKTHFTGGDRRASTGKADTSCNI